MANRANAKVCALTIAGLDPSGGAGIAADLRGFRAAGAWGCAACAVLTVQSTAGLVSVEAVASDLVIAQARAVLEHENVRAIKIGALGSIANVQAVSRLVGEFPHIPTVVDPVIVATRTPTGARLLDAHALDAMRELIAAAAIVTPNLDEAEALLGEQIRDERQLARAARSLMNLGCAAVLVKGGHLTQGPAVDALAFGARETLLRSERLDVPPFHGGGCSMAAMIAGWLAVHATDARDADIVGAVRFARRKLQAAIRRATAIGDGLLVLPV